MRSLTLKDSPGDCSLGPKNASIFPKLIRYVFPSIFCTFPVTISPTLSENSRMTRSFSASLMHCRMTCFAACVAIRPNSSISKLISSASPTSTSSLSSLASSMSNSFNGSVFVSTIVFSIHNRASPEFSSM